MDSNARGVVLLADATIADDGTQWIEVVPAVEKDRNGPWYFTITAPDDLQTFAESIAENASRIPIDRDHTGDTSGETRAAGWFTGETKIVMAGETTPRGETQEHSSLWAAVKWTPRAAQEIRDGEFRFLSPVTSFVNRDKKTGLLSKAKAVIAATITNRPHFKQMAPVLAAEVEAALDEMGDDVPNDTVVALRAVLTHIENARNGGRAAPNKEKTMSDELKGIAVALGLPEDADEPTVLAAVQAQKEKTEAVEGKTVVESDELATLKASAAKGEQAAKELDEMRVDTLLADAVRDGKIIPAQKDVLRAQALDHGIDGVKALIDATPARQMPPRGSGGNGPAGPDDEKVARAAERYESTEAEEVDLDSVRVDLRAREILKESGKTFDQATQAEYLAAARQATDELAVR